jgi:subtilisin
MKKKDKLPYKLPAYNVEGLSVACSETVDWGLRACSIPDAWKKTSGKDIKVAVLDTGASLKHPDLIGQILKAKDFTKSTSGPYDTNGHGTHCAGVVAGNKNDSGVIGVAPGCKLLIGKVLNDEGSGSSKGIFEGIKWAADEGADIISMSFGSPSKDKDITAAIKYAYSKGCYLVAAAGNEGPGEGTTNYPANLKECISVAAVDRNSLAAKFSSRGKVDIAAPGVDVTSCWPPKGYAKLSGTSMATPFVAGVLALVLSALKEEDIKYKALIGKITDTFYKTAVDAGKAGFDTTYGWGLIEPSSALKEARKILTSSRSKTGAKSERLVISSSDFTKDGLEKLISFIKKICDNQNP